MRPRMLVALLAGSAFFAALPILAPPVVLQSAGVPYLLAGLAGATAGGAVLRLVAGDRRAWGLVVACVIAGAILSTLVFLILGYGDWGAEAVIVALMLSVLTFAYMIVPAAAESGATPGAARGVRCAVDRCGRPRGSRVASEPKSEPGWTSENPLRPKFTEGPYPRMCE